MIVISCRLLNFAQSLNLDSVSISTFSHIHILGKIAKFEKNTLIVNLRRRRSRFQRKYFSQKSYFIWINIQFLNIWKENRGLWNEENENDQLNLKSLDLLNFEQNDSTNPPNRSHHDILKFLFKMSSSIWKIDKTERDRLPSCI